MIEEKIQEKSADLRYIPLQEIVDRLPVRRINTQGVARIRRSIERLGFLENFPLVIAPLWEEPGSYQLIEGGHRYVAAQELGLHIVPCLIKTNLTEQERYTLALASNEAAETMVPSTLVTYAEFVWQQSGTYTQQQIADMLGWSRDKVAKYDALKGITESAWNLIVTTFENSVTSDHDGGVTLNVTTVTFTEGLLRSILDLTPEQQVELVTELATNKDFSKGKFKALAESYYARNAMYALASQQLGDLGETSASRLHEELFSGAYDTDWRVQGHPKLQKLLEALRDEWERKHSIHLIPGDFYTEVQRIGDGSIDLILTDPPYNISRDNEFELEGRSNISQDFGSWDKQPLWAVIESFTVWAREWARILRFQGSGYVFTSDNTISHLRNALEQAGLHVKATIVWHKTNPGTQVVKTNFKSSVEYLLFFTKGEGGHTFNWQGENEMQNFVESAICAGKERMVDARGETLHPNQKPEQILRHFLEISSNRGDTVFDGFAGVGSTGKVAKDRGRKFIGIEQDQAFFEAMQRRLAE